MFSNPCYYYFIYIRAWQVSEDIYMFLSVKFYKRKDFSQFTKQVFLEEKKRERKWFGCELASDFVEFPCNEWNEIL